MKGDPHPGVKEKAELIRKHSIRIRKAQAELREAVRAAERDRISEIQLYC